jgi:hypothetical protein
MDLAPGHPLLEGQREMRLRSATMLSQQRQIGVLGTIEPPSLIAIRGIGKLWLNDGKIHARRMTPQGPVWVILDRPGRWRRSPEDRNPLKAGMIPVTGYPCHGIDVGHGCVSMSAA